MADTSTLNEIQYKIFEYDEVQKHATSDDCWVTCGKNVYDITEFLDKHPGGADLILNEAGTDISRILGDEYIHIHTANAYTILKDFKIGELNVNENQVEFDNRSDINAKSFRGYKEEIVDWNRGMVLQVHKFGRDYIKWVHSPVNRDLKLFDSNIMEFFTITRWFIIPLVWIPIVLSSGIYGYQELGAKTLSPSERNKSLSNNYLLIAAGIYFCVGVLIWTFLEYVLHRFFFHFDPNGNSPIQITLHFLFHGLHHKVPFDQGRLVIPPLLGFMFATSFWLILTIFPHGINAILFSGCMSGYTCYDLIHYYIHHGNPAEGTYLYEMKRYHVRHHFVDSNEGYGISTKLWDVVFSVEKRKFL